MCNKDRPISQLQHLEQYHHLQITRLFPITPGNLLDVPHALAYERTLQILNHHRARFFQAH